MSRWILCAALLCIPLATAGDLQGQEPAHAQEHDRLELQVRPKTAPSPGAVRATALVDRHSGNRALTLVAESLDYYRSSTVTLHGDRAARLHTLVFDQLPAGRYEITAVLQRADGPEVRRRMRVMISK